MTPDHIVDVEDRVRWETFAYEMGYNRPDNPNPYRHGTGSWYAWRAGREDRLEGKLPSGPHKDNG